MIPNRLTNHQISSNLHHWISKMDQDGTKSFQDGTQKDPKLENVFKMGAGIFPKRSQKCQKTSAKNNLFSDVYVFLICVVVLLTCSKENSDHVGSFFIEALKRRFCENHCFSSVKSINFKACTPQIIKFRTKIASFSNLHFQIFVLSMLV